MTESTIRHYFTDFPIWFAIKGETGELTLEDVYDWASSLVEDNLISEEEAAELGAAAKENPQLYAIAISGGDEGKRKGTESAASLGVPPSPGLSLKKSVEAFAEKARAAVKAFYDTNSVMLEDCEGDILALNNSIVNMQACVEKASASLYSMGKAMAYQKNEDTMKAISLLGDAIKELAGDGDSTESEEEAGAPADSLSSEVSSIYNEEPASPDSLPNPAGEEGA